MMTGYMRPMGHYEVDGRQFEAVTALSADQRYEHFIERCADTETVWGLARDGEERAISRDGAQAAFAVWPHERYAEACAAGGWLHYRPEPLPLAAFLDDLTTKLDADGLLVEVFRVRGDRARPGSAVPPRRLRSDLERELQAYE